MIFEEKNNIELFRYIAISYQIVKKDTAGRRLFFYWLNKDLRWKKKNLVLEKIFFCGFSRISSSASQIPRILKDSVKFSIFCDPYTRQSKILKSRKAFESVEYRKKAHNEKCFFFGEFPYYQTEQKITC